MDLHPKHIELGAITRDRPSWSRVLKSALVALAFVAALGAGTSLIYWRAGVTRGEAAVTAAPIPVATVRLVAAAGYTVTDRFVGQLEPAQTARLAFERGGLVTSVSVEEGQPVAAGAVIATLDTRLLEAERDRLAGQRQRLVAELELARLTEERQLSLERQGHASTQRFDEARLAKAALAGELTSLDASIRRLEIDLDKSLLRAPFAGTIGARDVDPGTVVAPGEPVAALLETARPQARVGLSPEAAATLAAGDTLELNAGGRMVEARLLALRPDLSTSTRTTSALLELAVPAELHFGDTVELRVDRTVEAPGFWLPLAALREGERGLWSVLTLVPEDGPDGHARIGHEVVEVLHMDADRVFVRGTLEDGQIAVASGHNRVIPGQAAVAAAPSKDGS